LVSYRQHDQHGIKQVVLHERETSSSGRPKATLASEDVNYFYDQTRSGVITKYEKNPLQHYDYWYRTNVKHQSTDKGTKRITPLSEFEKQMGVRLALPVTILHGQKYSEKEWDAFQQKRVDSGIDKLRSAGGGDSGVYYRYETDTDKFSSGGKIDWHGYFTEKAREKDLIVVDINNLHFQEKQKPAVVEKIPPPARPNPKEKSIASVKIEKPEPIEIEPIKEVAKYSPLMIAGVIAVVVILLLKRRSA